MDADLLSPERRAERGQDQPQAGGRLGRDQAIGQPVQPSQLSPRRGVDLLAREQRGDIVGMGCARVELGHHPAVPQDHDPAGQAEHLLDIAADQQNRRAAVA